MSQEIERKFLVKNPPTYAYDESAEIRQGYLKVDRHSEIRVAERFGIPWLTKKSGNGIVREEKDIEIPIEAFDVLWELTEGKRIYKTRYYYDVNDLTYELDVYNREDGLMVVEVEFKSREEAEAFTPPDWFGEDVTNNPKYKNSALAQ